MKKMFSNLWFYAGICMILISFLGKSPIFIILGVLAIFLAIFSPVKGKETIKKK